MVEFDVGIEHVAGDMFVSIPKGDAIFMKVICFCHSRPPSRVLIY